MKYALQKLITALVLLCLANAISVCANEQNDANGYLFNSNQWHFATAIGYGQYANPLNQGNDLAVYVLPDIRYFGERVSIDNLTLAYSLYEKPNWVVELSTKQNLDGLYFPGKHRNTYAALNGVHPGRPWELNKEPVNYSVPVSPTHRSLSYLAGVEVRYYGALNVQASWHQDISNVHHGSEALLNLTKSIQMPDYLIEFGVFLNFKSSKLSNYYYSPTEADLFGIPPDYTAGSGINRGVIVSYAKPISDSLALVASYSYTQFATSIANSPLLSSHSKHNYFAGVKYVF